MKDLNQADWKAQIEANENAVILDVRRPDECEEGIIPNAITIDIMNPQPFLKEVEKLDKNVPYFIYYRSEARSGQACLIMEDLGFEETYNLIGGILEWNGDIV